MTTTKAMPKQTKYKYIKEFARLARISRTWAFNALEGQSPEMWERYASFLESRAERLRAAKARASNARQLSEPEFAALAAQ